MLPCGGASVHAHPPLPVTAQIDDLEERLFQEVGEGGFESIDFEIVQEMGSISMQQVKTALEQSCTQSCTKGSSIEPSLCCAPSRPSLTGGRATRAPPSLHSQPASTQECPTHSP